MPIALDKIASTFTLDMQSNEMGTTDNNLNITKNMFSHKSKDFIKSINSSDNILPISIIKEKDSNFN